MAHAHTHHHDHHHGHDHSHDHGPRRATAQKPAVSLLRASAAARLAIVGVCVLGLWAAVFWAMA